MMASRIYRKLSSNFLNQSLIISSFHHQRSLTSSNFTSHNKLASLNPQNLIKLPYSQNPMRHNIINHSDYSSSSQLLFVKNLTPKSLTHSRNSQNPYGIHGNPRFVSTSNPNQSSENPKTPFENPTENDELKHKEMRGPSRDESDLETYMKSVYRLSMISGGFGLLNIGLGFWIPEVVPDLGLVAVGIPLSLAFIMGKGLKALKQGRLQVITFEFNKKLFFYWIGVSYFALAGAMLALVFLLRV